MKIDLLRPEARPVFKRFLSALEKSGLQYVVLETIRTQEIQNAYYAQGRESIQEVNRLRKIAGLHPLDAEEAKRVITKSEHSAHQEGIAADIVPVLADGSIPWTITKENAHLWLSLGRLGMEAGLEWGGTWEPLNSFGIGWDAAHYQLPKTVSTKNTLNDRLINSFHQDAPIGLAHGKMGFCLFAFWLARQEKNKEYQRVAENLLDDIFSQATQTRSADLMNGLSGIGLAIRYLLKEFYVKGNPNDILGDIDNEIFKQLSYPVYLDNMSLLSVIHILFYLTLRAADQKKGSELEYLYQELIISTVNHIYQKADASFYEEPMLFGINYLLPQFLFVLSRIYKLDFYNYRIMKILEEMGIKVLSILPTLHANRLFLMWGMDSVVQQIDLFGWNSHIQLLKERIDIDAILDDELRSRNIYIDGGVSGIYLLLSALQKHFTENEMQQWMTKVIDKIESSDVWTLVEENPDFFMGNRGLFSGLCGVSIVLTDVKSKYSQL